MKFIRKIILAAIFLFTGIYANAQSQAYFDALDAYNSGNRQAAYRQFSDLVDAEPGNDAAYYYLAILSEDFLEREANFKQAIALDPGNFWYKYALASDYMSNKDADKALALFEELIRDNPKKTSLYYDVVNIYMAKGYSDKAMEALDVIEAQTGKSDPLAMARMQVYMQKGDQQKAFEFLKDYYKDYRSPRLACIMAEYYAGLFQQQEAIKYFEEALEMDPDCVEASYGLAHIYRSLGQYDMYFKHINDFIKSDEVPAEDKVAYMQDLLGSGQFAQMFAPQIDTLMTEMYTSSPTDTTVTGLTAAYYYQTGQVDKALDVYAGILEENPDDAGAAFTHCLIYYYAEDWDNVVTYATAAIQRFDMPLDFLQLRGIAFWQLKEYDNSMEDYRTMLSMAPKDSSVALSCYTAMGDLYHMAGDPKQAYKCYDKALRINPDHAPVLNNYAYYLTETYDKPLKRPDATLRKAMQMSLKTIQQEPDNPTYVDTYAWLLHLVGRDVEAKAMFKHAMLYGGKESRTILEHYATVLQTLGENDLANVYFKQAEALGPDE
ncbi:MAG: tetratricopeptide repeat protein [Bacteroidales bacterium]|nr:tetratricopeptide repeat protein [Bacteroidales bacterium]